MIPPGWDAQIDSWREFFLMTGTAAVTLAGLLFVALSLHVDALVRETREHLVALARVNLFSFVFVLMLSLVMLIPHEGMRVKGATLVALGAPFFIMTLGQMRSRATDHADFSLALFRRRLFAPLGGYAATVFVGIAVMRRNPELIGGLVAVTFLLLGNAAGTSWDLLVRVARIRHHGESERAGR